MPRKEDSLPKKWELLMDQAFDAQIVSIHTGAMEENQWYEMNFSEAEALLLFSSASQYFLPSFLSSMTKLKVLIVFNYGSKRATVNGLPLLSSLTKLKTIRLEKLNVPPLQEQSKVSQNLEKLSVSLCEGLGDMSSFNLTRSSLKFPAMLDFNLDHCCDLEKLPPGLKELPASIGKLGKLEYLDISLCECLKELPEEIGQLRKLEELNMRECSRLRKLPKSVGGMRSLKHVICDEKIGQQWNRVKSSFMMEVIVEVAEAHFSLDWLND